MQVDVHFYSYFKDLTGCGCITLKLARSATIRDLLEQLGPRFPKLAAMQKSILIAVGVEYQHRDYILSDGDVVSLFPPVQGG